MMPAYPVWAFIGAVILAAVLDIAANLLLTKSRGFTVMRYSISALVLVGLAFTCLAFAVQGMDLAVAYAMWGAFGILGTSLGGWALFGQRLKGKAWVGIAMLIGGISILHLA
jgi:spermidine export protein MdtI